MQSRPVKLTKPLKNTIVYLAARAGLIFALFLPRPIGLWLFGSLARIVFLFPNREKQRTIEHLRLIFGKTWSHKKILTTAKNVYRSLGKNLFDAVYLSQASSTRFNALVKHDDLTPVKAAYDRGNGIMVIAAHIGCFEMLLHFFARHGFKCFAVGKQSFDPRLDNLIRSIRCGEDIDYMDRSESPRKIIRGLQEGKAFGVLIDQDTRVEGVFAPFLGLPAHTPSVPIRMAMRYKIPTVVATTLRMSDTTHYVYLSKVLEFANTGNFEADLVTNVTMANDLICKSIRKDPEQWVWMHRRWKTKPQPSA